MITVSKDRLHQLIDLLPDSELPTAVRILEALRATADPVLWALDHAPEEPDDGLDDLDGGLTEARAEMERGEGVSLDEVKRQLGIP